MLTIKVASSASRLYMCYSSVFCMWNITHYMENEKHRKRNDNDVTFFCDGKIDSDVDCGFTVHTSTTSFPFFPILNNTMLCAPLHSVSDHIFNSRTIYFFLRDTFLTIVQCDGTNSFNDEINFRKRQMPCKF